MSLLTQTLAGGAHFFFNNQKWNSNTDKAPHDGFVLAVYLLSFVPRKCTHGNPWTCSVFRCVLRFPLPWREVLQASFSFFPYTRCCCLLFRRKPPKPQILTSKAAYQVNRVAALGIRRFYILLLICYSLDPSASSPSRKLERIRDSMLIIN